MWQIDGLIAALANASSLLTTQSKLAEDLEIWASNEFDYVTIADGYSRSSVLMPQKRNPYALSIIRGASGTLIGRLTGFLAVSKSPSARSDNLIYAYGEIPRALDLALRTTRLTTGVIRTLTVNADKMWAALESGFCQATDLAEYVMQTCNVDYRTAYQVVGVAVRNASREGLRGIDLDGAHDRCRRPGVRRPVPRARRTRTSPRSSTRGASSRPAPLAGGAAPPVVEAMADDCAATAAALRAARDRPAPAFQQAESDLLDEAEAFITKETTMTTATKRPETQRPVHLPDEVNVVNVGLGLFADAVAQQGRPVVQVDWRIPGGGDAEVVAALRRTFGPHAEVIDRANAEVFARLDRGAPQLVDVQSARDVIPVLAEGMVLLHCGPRIDIGRVSDPLRRSMRAAVCAEGWAATPADADRLLLDGTVRLEPANHHGVVVPMATSMGPSAPVWVVELADARHPHVRTRRPGLR